jgi:hypothetical protein
VVKIGHKFGDPNQLDELSEAQIWVFGGDCGLGGATEIHGS